MIFYKTFVKGGQIVSEWLGLLHVAVIIFVDFQVEDVVVTVPFPKQVLNVNLTPSGVK